MKAFGKILKGKIIFNDKAKFLNDIAKFDNDINIVIEVREAKNIRTNAQNKLWWKWMDVIANETGNNKQEIHSILKYKFLLKEEMIDGEIHQGLKSTTSLSKEEFSKLTKDVFYWANDTLKINLPNE